MAHRCPVTVEEHQAVVYAVWKWIIGVNNGNGFDTEDLMAVMEATGAGCPTDLDEDGELIEYPPQ